MSICSETDDDEVPARTLGSLEKIDGGACNTDDTSATVNFGPKVNKILEESAKGRGTESSAEPPQYSSSLQVIIQHNFVYKDDRICWQHDFYTIAGHFCFLKFKNFLAHFSYVSSLRAKCW